MTKYYQRVAQTAILPTNFRFPKKEKLSKDLMQKSFAVLSDSFLGKNRVDSSKIGQTLRKIIPGVKLLVRPNKNSSAIAQMGYLFSSKNNLINGFTIELPQGEKTKTILSKNIHYVMHEIRHIIDSVLNPKYTARTNRAHLASEYKGFNKRANTYDEFYNRVLYPDERTVDDIRIMRKNRKNSKKIRTKKIETGIREVFSDPKISSNEKIHMLQEWRYSLIMEKNAYSDQVLYENQMLLKRKLFYPNVNQIELIKETEKRIKRQIHGLVEEDHFFSAKIDIIKKLLKEEIADHRKKHSQNIKQSSAQM